VGLGLPAWGLSRDVLLLLCLLAPYSSHHHLPTFDLFLYLLQSFVVLTFAPTTLYLCQFLHCFIHPLLQLGFLVMLISFSGSGNLGFNYTNPFDAFLPRTLPTYIHICRSDTTRCWEKAVATLLTYNKSLQTRYNYIEQIVCSLVHLSQIHLDSRQHTFVPTSSFGGGPS